MNTLIAPLFTVAAIVMASVLTLVSIRRYRKVQRRNEADKPAKHGVRRWTRVFGWEYFLHCPLFMLSAYILLAGLWFMELFTGDNGSAGFIIMPMTQGAFMLAYHLMARNLYASWEQYNFRTLKRNNLEQVCGMIFFVWSVTGIMVFNVWHIDFDDIFRTLPALSLIIYVPILLFVLHLCLFVCYGNQFSLWSETLAEKPEADYSVYYYTSAGTDTKTIDKDRQYPSQHRRRTLWFSRQTHFQDTTDPDWLDSGDENDVFGYSSNQNTGTKSDGYDRRVRFDDEDHW